jgi:flagellar protein FliO/FliZ
MIESVLRLVFSMAIVLGLLLVLARVSARRMRGSSDSLVSVLHKQPLSRTTSVAVVTVAERVLVLGTTEHSVSVLAELEPDELPVPEVATPAPVAPAGRPSIRGSVLSTETWKQAFAAAAGRTGVSSNALAGGDESR